MKQFLLIIFIVTIAISIILIGPACSKKTDSADINSTEANTNGIEFSEIKAPIENKIAYIHNVFGNIEIYIMNIDGSEQTRLTENPAYDTEPCFSSDGSKIAFVSKRDGNLEIYIMNVDGSEQINLTNNPAWDAWPCFSPDGSKIVFTSHRNGNWDIYIMNTEGSIQLNLTKNNGGNFNPVFQP